MPTYDDAIYEAMLTLLSKQQIAFVYDRTHLGPSRKQIVRNLVKRGIEDLEREESRAA